MSTSPGGDALLIVVTLVSGRSARIAFLASHTCSCIIVGANAVFFALLVSHFACFRAFFVSLPPLEGDFSQ